MKKILIGLILCFLLTGCQKDKIDINEPAIQAASRIGIAAYIEKNKESAEHILALNEIVQGIEYNATMYTYDIDAFTLAILDEIPTDLAPMEKVAVISMVELLFSLANDQFSSADHEMSGYDVVDPEYLEMIKILFNNAAQVAKLYKEVE